jgi:hypothetical protein
LIPRNTSEKSVFFRHDIDIDIDDDIDDDIDIDVSGLFAIGYRKGIERVYVILYPTPL